MGTFNRILDVTRGKTASGSPRSSPKPEPKTGVRGPSFPSDEVYRTAYSELQQLNDEILRMEKTLGNIKGNTAAAEAKGAAFVRPPSPPKAAVNLFTSKIPSIYHVKAEAPIPQIFDAFSKVFFNELTKTWESPIFPTGAPTTRDEVVLLSQALDSMLAACRVQNVPRMSVQKVLSEQLPDVTAMIDDLNAFNREFTVYNIGLAEIIRQVHVQCAERGELIEQIRKRVVELFGILIALAFRMIRQHQEDTWFRAQVNVSRIKSNKEEEILRQEVTRTKKERDDVGQRLVIAERQLSNLYNQHEDYYARTTKERHILEYEVKQLQKQVDYAMMDKETALREATTPMQLAIQQLTKEKHAAELQLEYVHRQLDNALHRLKTGHAEFTSDLGTQTDDAAAALLTTSQRSSPIRTMSIRRVNSAPPSRSIGTQSDEGLRSKSAVDLAAVVDEPIPETPEEGTGTRDREGIEHSGSDTEADENYSSRTSRSGRKRGVVTIIEGPSKSLSRSASSRRRLSSSSQRNLQDAFDERSGDHSQEDRSGEHTGDTFDSGSAPPTSRSGRHSARGSLSGAEAHGTSSHNFSAFSRSASGRSLRDRGKDTADQGGAGSATLATSSSGAGHMDGAGAGSEVIRAGKGDQKADGAGRRKKAGSPHVGLFRVAMLGKQPKGTSPGPTTSGAGGRASPLRGRQSPQPSPPKKPLTVPKGKGKNSLGYFAKLLTIDPTRQGRVRPRRYVQKLITQIYGDKVIADAMDERVQARKQGLPEFVYDYHLNNFGLQSLAEMYISDLIASVHAYQSHSARIKMFGRFCGILDPLPDDAAVFYLYAMNVVQTCAGGPIYADLQDSLFSIPLNRALNATSILLSANVSAEQLELDLQEVESHATDGRIDQDDFLGMMVRLWEREIDSITQRLSALIAAGQMPTAGRLSFDDFKKIVQNVAPHFSHREILRMYREGLHLSDSDCISEEVLMTVLRAHSYLAWKAPSTSRPATSNEEEDNTLDITWYSMGKDFTVLETVWETSEEWIRQKMSAVQAANATMYFPLLQRLTQFKQLLAARQDCGAAWVSYRLLVSDLHRCFLTHVMHDEGSPSANGELLDETLKHTAPLPLETGEAIDDQDGADEDKDNDVVDEDEDPADNATDEVPLHHPGPNDNNNVTSGSRPSSSKDAIPGSRPGSSKHTLSESRPSSSRNAMSGSRPTSSKRAMFDPNPPSVLFVDPAGSY